MLREELHSFYLFPPFFQVTFPSLKLTLPVPFIIRVLSIPNILSFRKYLESIKGLPGISFIDMAALLYLLCKPVHLTIIEKNTSNFHPFEFNFFNGVKILDGFIFSLNSLLS